MQTDEVVNHNQCGYFGSDFDAQKIQVCIRDKLKPVGFFRQSRAESNRLSLMPDLSSSNTLSHSNIIYLLVFGHSDLWVMVPPDVKTGKLFATSANIHK